MGIQFRTSGNNNVFWELVNRKEDFKQAVKELVKRERSDRIRRVSGVNKLPRN